MRMYLCGILECQLPLLDLRQRPQEGRIASKAAVIATYGFGPRQTLHRLGKSLDSPWALFKSALGGMAGNQSRAGVA